MDGEEYVISPPGGLRVSEESKEEKLRALTLPDRVRFTADLGAPPGASRGKGKRSMAGGTMDIPPPRHLTCNIHHVYRFRCTASGTYAVTIANFVGSLGVMGTVVNSTAVTLASSFKLRSIKMWPPSNAGSDFGYLEWASAWTTLQRDEQVLASLPDGITVPTSLTFRPGKGSIAAMWTSNNANSAYFNLNAVTGAIIDVDVDWTITNALASQSIAGFAAIALGSIYYLALDGRASNKLLPIGLASTA